MCCGAGQSAVTATCFATNPAWKLAPSSGTNGLPSSCDLHTVPVFLSEHPLVHHQMSFPRTMITFSTYLQRTTFLSELHVQPRNTCRSAISWCHRLQRQRKVSCISFGSG